MSGVQLVLPDIRYKDSYVAALREGLNTEPTRENEILLAEKDFVAYQMRQNDMSRKIVLPDGREISKLPQTDYWLVEGEKFIGRTGLRPQLNEHLLERGGNIGYSIRKSERRKGYGKMILKFVLPEARKAGLQKVLITCHDENLGSIKIIESAGGVLQDKIKIAGLTVPERRYWIEL